MFFNGRKQQLVAGLGDSYGTNGGVVLIVESIVFWAFCVGRAASIFAMPVNLLGRNRNLQLQQPVQV